MPPSLQHLAGGFADWSASWRNARAGAGHKVNCLCASEADAGWSTTSAACLPRADCVLIGFDRWLRLWQLVSPAWTLIPSHWSQTASSLWVLGFSANAFALGDGSQEQQGRSSKAAVGLEERLALPQSQWEVLMSARRHHLLWKLRERSRKAQESRRLWYQEHQTWKH